MRRAVKVALWSLAVLFVTSAVVAVAVGGYAVYLASQYKDDLLSAEAQRCLGLREPALLAAQMRQDGTVSLDQAISHIIEDVQRRDDKEILAGITIMAFKEPRQGTPATRARAASLWADELVSVCLSDRPV